jgi:hypothetical protein
LPRSTECRTAADSASWLFVVSLLASMYSRSVFDLYERQRARS